MGGGQDSESSARLQSWDGDWEGDWDSENEEETNDEKPSVDPTVSGSSEGEEHGKDAEKVTQESSSCVTSPKALESPQSELMRRIIRHGETLATRDNIRQIRSKLNRYTPGSTMLYAERKKAKVFAIPDVTTLLIVGFKGVGKSTLVNNLIRVLQNKSTGVYRAQVSDDPHENGTYFMGEYMICGVSERPRVSIFDTRGLSEDKDSENRTLLEQWMTDGVRHGQMDLRASDSIRTKESLETRGRHVDHRVSKKRNVNFVIFVMDAVSVLKIKENGDTKKRTQLVELYKNPYLTFKDDRPLVVLTHGDKLSVKDRIAAHLYLGEIFGIPPVEQIFDISGAPIDTRNGVEANDIRDITVLDMLTFALECADRNLPYRRSSMTSLKEIWKSLAESYVALEHDRKVALIGMIICVHILFILFIIAAVSLSHMSTKRRWRW